MAYVEERLHIHSRGSMLQMLTWTRSKMSPFGMNCRTVHNIALFCLRPVNPVRHKFQTHSAPSRASEGQSSLPVDFLGDHVKSEHRPMFFGENHDPPDRFLSPTLPLPWTNTNDHTGYLWLIWMWDSGSPRLPCVQLWPQVMFTNNLMTRAKKPYLQFKCPEPSFKVKSIAEYTGGTATVATHTWHVLSSAR
jgi:hypothetical protein